MIINPNQPTNPSDEGYVITEQDYDRLWSKFDDARREADKKLKGLSKEQIHKFRARAKRDLFFLNTSFLGYMDLQPRLHGEWCDWIRRTMYHFQYSLGLLPRAHFKTSTKTISHNIQVALPYTEEDRLCDEFLVYNKDPIYNPLAYPMNLGVNNRILIIHEVENEASRFLFMITSHFMSNPMMMAAYPECVPERRIQEINKTALTLPRDGIFGEPTFDAKGVSAKQQGNHYTLISPDDIFGKEARKSEAESQQRRDFIDGIFGFFDNLSKTKLFAVGTRYKFDDVYGHMIDKFGDQMDVYKRKVEERNPKTGKDEIIFPERVTPKHLEIIKKNKEIYNSEWLNSPEEIGEGFQEEWWLEFEWLDSVRIAVFDGNPSHPTVMNIRDMYISFHIDPGKVTGGFTICGTDYYWRTFTLAAIPIDFPSIALVELLFRQATKWHPSLVSIEHDANQHYLGDWVKREMSLRNIYFEIYEYWTKKVAKPKRIDSLSQLYSSKQLFHNALQTELKLEFTRFGKIGIDSIHILDALAHIMDEGVRRQGFPPGSFGVIGSIDKQHPYQSEIDPETGYSVIEMEGY